MASYLPFLKGRYEIRAGLQTLGTDFGNGELDGRIFQLDQDYANYLQEKQTSCEQINEYYLLQDDVAEYTLGSINQAILSRLVAEYPKEFTYEDHLFCKGEQHIDVRAYSPKDLFHQLAMLVQEDFALVSKRQQDYQLVMLHVLLPNYWSPKDKIGTDFSTTHGPVPHMQNINQVSNNLFDHVIQKGPFVRFAWGITADQSLNCHPQLRHLSFTRPIEDKAYVRVERQVLWGFAQLNSVLFTIRTYHYDVNRLTPDQCQALISAINSMDEQVLEYKGLTGKVSKLLKIIDAP